jgi:hypothetical protein
VEKSSHAVLATTGFGAFAATLCLAAPALAMPDGVGSAQDVVEALKAGGYQVVMNNAVTAALTNCTVIAVRPGPIVEKSTATTVYVDVKC